MQHGAIAALFEQGKVRIVGVLPKLEDQLGGFTRRGFEGRGSPDRADAAIWALSDLMLENTTTYDVSMAWVG